MNEKFPNLQKRLTIAKEANWLYEKFGDGEYHDILGLCKVAIQQMMVISLMRLISLRIQVMPISFLMAITSTIFLRVICLLVN